jgi:hypothetical protein
MTKRTIREWASDCTLNLPSGTSLPARVSVLEVLDDAKSTAWFGRGQVAGVGEMIQISLASPMGMNFPDGRGGPVQAFKTVFSDEVDPNLPPGTHPEVREFLEKRPRIDPEDLGACFYFVGLGILPAEE